MAVANLAAIAHGAFRGPSFERGRRRAWARLGALGGVAGIVLVIAATAKVSRGALFESRAHGGIPGWKTFDPDLRQTAFASAVERATHPGDVLYFHRGFPGPPPHRMDWAFYYDRDMTRDVGLPAMLHLSPAQQSHAVALLLIGGMGPGELSAFATLANAHPFVRIDNLAFIDLRTSGRRFMAYRTAPAERTGEGHLRRWLEGPYLTLAWSVPWRPRRPTPNGSIGCWNRLGGDEIGRTRSPAGPPMSALDGERPWPRWFWPAFVVGVAVNLLPLVVAPILPFCDLHGAAALLGALLHRGDPAARIDHYFTFNVHPSPNAIYWAVGWLLGQVMSVEAATNVYIGLFCIVALPVSLLVAVRALGKDPTLSLLARPSSITAASGTGSWAASRRLRCCCWCWRSPAGRLRAPVPVGGTRRSPARC